MMYDRISGPNSGSGARTDRISPDFIVGAFDFYPQDFWLGRSGAGVRCGGALGDVGGGGGVFLAPSFKFI